MSEIITYITQNASGFFAVLTALVTVASTVAALTPTPKDDAFASKAYKLVDWLAINTGRAKDK